MLQQFKAAELIKRPGLIGKTQPWLYFYSPSTLIISTPAVLKNSRAIGSTR